MTGRAPPYDDETWARVTAEAAPFPPLAIARDRYDDILREHDQARELELPKVKAERAAWLAIDDQLERAMNGLIRLRDERLLLGSWTDDDQTTLFALGQGRRHARTRARGCDAILSAHQGRQDPIRNKLYTDLVRLFEEYFGSADGMPPSAVPTGSRSDPRIGIISATLEALGEPVNLESIRTALRRPGVSSTKK